jgi:hypothetical protein
MQNQRKTVRFIARTIRHAPQLARSVWRDPIAAWYWARESIADPGEYQGQACPYDAAEDWEQRLHATIDAPWPCEAASDFWALWPEVMQPFEVKGTPIGRAAFGGWGDGEPGLVRALWCLVQHLRPATVIETGVARGFTSRFILEALERNGAGHLWSIDLPPMRAPKLHSQIGMAVRPELRHRWSYVRGTSRQHLPKLLAQLGQIDLFVHDSRHTERNVLFELTQAWSALRAGGAVVADDIDENWGFDAFTRRVSPPCVLNCFAEPLRPDPPRFAAKGLFGIALNCESASSLKLRHDVT